jgi:hypothetical protein
MSGSGVSRFVEASKVDSGPILAPLAAPPITQEEEWI